MTQEKDLRLTILSGWHIRKHQGTFYIIRLHKLYIRMMAERFRSITLLAPVETVGEQEDCKDLSVLAIRNVKIYPLPYTKHSVDAIFHKKAYKETIRSVAPYTDIFYCRVPDPFCWMPAQITDKPVIMHFVGDTADATRHNIHFSWLKKKILLAGYSFEYRRILKSAKLSTVYTNGTHLSTKLKRIGVDATPVVSSTITKDTLANMPLHPLNSKPFTLIYVGYLRYAKGIDTLISVTERLEANDFDYHFHIVGSGEMSSTLHQFVENKHLENRVLMHGHIDDREKLFSLLRSSDLFFFPSLSEGSPRVVIEAMSQGCPVLSTPVGSLPGCFKDKRDILFFPFEDAKAASEMIIDASNNLDRLASMRDRAYNEVKNNYTMEKFIRSITTYHHEA